MRSGAAGSRREGRRWAPARGGGEAGRGGGGATTHERGGIMNGGIMGLVCVGLVVLLGVWLLFGLIRAFTGAGRYRGGYGPGPGGPGGYGPGYGPGYGGGGGGG